MKPLRQLALAAMLTTLACGSAQASLATFQTFVGNYGVSTDGFGSTTQAGTISAFVPAGATVQAAYLYTSTFSSIAGIGGTLAGTNVNYATLLGVTGGLNNLQAARADVTSIVKPLVDGGVGGTYNFRITETSALQDGEALVVVYSLGSAPVSTVAILDGFAATTGDTATLNFATPIDKTIPGFQAEMRLGIGYSYDGAPCGTAPGQTSSVAVNGTTITNNAGCNDDSVDATPADGNLITVGGDNDAFSPMLPTIAQDHERYNLVPQITTGDTSISIRTANASNNDNIFLAVFQVSGEATVNDGGQVPEPTGLALVGLGLLGLGAQRQLRTRR
jgi:hypothetical protein